MIDIVFEILRPGAHFYLRNFDLDNIDWRDPRPVPTKEEIMNCLNSLPEALRLKELHEQTMKESKEQ
jgi:hypothetical protein